MAASEDSSSKTPDFPERPLSGNRDGRFGHRPACGNLPANNQKSLLRRTIHIE